MLGRDGGRGEDVEEAGEDALLEADVLGRDDVAEQEGRGRGAVRRARPDEDVDDVEDEVDGLEIRLGRVLGQLEVGEPDLERHVVLGELVEVRLALAEEPVPPRLADPAVDHVLHDRLAVVHQPVLVVLDEDPDQLRRVQRPAPRRQLARRRRFRSAVAARRRRRRRPPRVRTEEDAHQLVRVLRLAEELAQLGRRRIVHDRHERPRRPDVVLEPPLEELDRLRRVAVQVAGERRGERRRSVLLEHRLRVDDERDELEEELLRAREREQAEDVDERVHDGQLAAVVLRVEGRPGQGADVAAEGAEVDEELDADLDLEVARQELEQPPEPAEVADGQRLGLGQVEEDGLEGRLEELLGELAEVGQHGLEALADRVGHLGRARVEQLEVDLRGQPALRSPPAAPAASCAASGAVAPLSCSPTEPTRTASPRPPPRPRSADRTARARRRAGGRRRCGAG